MGSVQGVGVALAGLASLHLRAIRLAGAAAALAEATGVAFEVFGEGAAQVRLAAARRALGEAAAEAAWSAGHMMATDDAVRYALAAGSDD
jgi:hypothetical protein